VRAHRAQILHIFRNHAVSRLSCRHPAATTSLTESPAPCPSPAAVNSAQFNNATQQVRSNLEDQPQFAAAKKLYSYFETPQQLEDQCSGYYTRALLMLVGFGVAFRLLALLVLWVRVYARRPKVRNTLRCLPCC
jgi:hypothetical protein